MLLEELRVLPKELLALEEEPRVLEEELWMLEAEVRVEVVKDVRDDEALVQDPKGD